MHIFQQLNFNPALRDIIVVRTTRIKTIFMYVLRNSYILKTDESLLPVQSKR